MGVRDDIVAYAQRQIGCVYSYVPSGGVEGRSYNCSFLSTCAYKAAGISIPGWQGHQNGDGSQSDWVRRAGHWTTHASDLKPGDLVFFGSSPTYTTHVGISLGGNRMIDSVPDGGVQERRLYSSFVGGGWPLATVPAESTTPASTEGVIPVSITRTLKYDMNIREKPTTKSSIVGTYAAGSSVAFDQILVEAGYVWGSYVGRNSGKRRYVAIGPSSNVQ